MLILSFRFSEGALRGVLGQAVVSEAAKKVALSPVRLGLSTGSPHPHLPPAHTQPEQHQHHLTHRKVCVNMS